VIAYTPEDLVVIANKEFAWCDNEMLRASREMGFGDDWKKALEKVKNDYVAPGKMIYLVRDQQKEALEFMEAHDLVTIPPLVREDWWEEGMAFYWEMLMWDLGYDRTPEQRIGVLFWRMHRCARIIFSLNFHLGQWPAQKCVDFLVERVGHERANAEGEVRRSFDGSYEPI
jgi:hypothetical protein